MADKDPGNRRRFVRLKANYILRHEKYTLKSQGGKEPVEGIIKDYSSGGALFESDSKYNIGDLVKLEVMVLGWERFKNEFYKSDKLSSSQPLVVLATVVRVDVVIPDKLYDIGVCFAGVDEGHQEALVKYINSQLKKG